MDKEKGYKIGFESSKSYQITAYKKQQECVICGKMSKVGNRCSTGRKQHLKFVCSDCLASFLHQYSGVKAGSLKQFIANKIVKKQKADKAPNVKCRLCGKIIKITQWRNHLTSIHHTNKDVTFRDFFIRENADICKAQKQWYNDSNKKTGKFYCGAIVNGSPKVKKIIYNATFSSRRKF